MILAAGLGTRLRPLTDSMPKALVPVDGVPLLRRVMDRFCAYGVNDFVVNVHHFPDQIVDFLKENAPCGASVGISDERDALLETGGAIRRAAPLLRGGGGFFVHNVDIMSNADFGYLAGEVRPEAFATLLVSDRKTQRYLLFDDDMRMVGWTNDATGEVRSPYAGVKVSDCRKLAFSGIQFLSERILDEMDPMPERFPIVDFYLSVLDRLPIYGVVQQGLSLMDAGKISTLSEAEQFVRRNCSALPE